VQSLQKVGSSKKFKVLYWHLLAKWGYQEESPIQANQSTKWDLNSVLLQQRQVRQRDNSDVWYQIRHSLML